jgi:hypothetical protein
MIIKYKINKYGTKYWYQNDQLHKTDGPAIIYPDSSKLWYQNNQVHRTDGPAIEYADGLKSWYIKDKRYPEEEYRKQLISK